MSNLIHRIGYILRLLLTRGPGTQNFLGAPWVPLLLRLAPRSKKERLALNLLALSPHYFFRDHHPAGVPRNPFLNLERERNDRARKQICDQVLRPYLGKDSAVLDYGCGPGFLARHVSGYVNKVFAGDISPGTIACARIINPAPNLRYFVTGREGELPFPAESLDLVYSFAVIQHLSDRIFGDLLEDFYRWLKPGGRAALHIVADEAGWKTEEECLGDHSLSGRFRGRYGVYCFGRSGEEVEKMIAAAGFLGIRNMRIADISRIDDDVGSQSLFVFIRPEKK